MTNATYIKKSTLNFSDLWESFGMKKDDGGRWYQSEDTPEWVCEFLSQYREPSRAWPMSHAKPMLTQKFSKLVVEQDPELAIKLHIAESV